MMTKEEAVEMLKYALRGETPSNVNACLTQTQCVEIVERGINSLPDGSVLNYIIEERVHQVCKNRRHPKL